MNSLICPISIEKINKSVVRITGFLVVLTVLFYAVTGNVLFMVFLLADFIIRGFTQIRVSPYAFVAKRLSKLFGFKPVMIDKAPKLFASRVGFLFALTSVSLYFISPLYSLVVALVLMLFAALESLFDFCVGCLVYTYVILPLNNRSKK